MNTLWISLQSVEYLRQQSKQIRQKNKDHKNNHIMQNTQNNNLQL